MDENNTQKVTSDKLKKTYEYKNPHKEPKKVKCEIKDLIFPLKNILKEENDSLKVRIFRITGCASKSMGSNYSGSSEVEGFYENVVTHSMDSFEAKEDFD